MRRCQSPIKRLYQINCRLPGADHPGSLHGAVICLRPAAAGLEPDDCLPDQPAQRGWVRMAAGDDFAVWDRYLPLTCLSALGSHTDLWRADRGLTVRPAELSADWRME